jgi:hypothetical protein
MSTYKTIGGSKMKRLMRLHGKAKCPYCGEKNNAVTGRYCIHLWEVIYSEEAWFLIFSKDGENPFND